jgi:hypothetical protein
VRGLCRASASEACDTLIVWPDGVADHERVALATLEPDKSPSNSKPSAPPQSREQFVAPRRARADVLVLVDLDPPLAEAARRHVGEVVLLSLGRPGLEEGRQLARDRGRGVRAGEDEVDAGGATSSKGTSPLPRKWTRSSKPNVVPSGIQMSPPGWSCSNAPTPTTAASSTTRAR